MGFIVKTDKWAKLCIQRVIYNQEVRWKLIDGKLLGGNNKEKENSG